MKDSTISHYKVLEKLGEGGMGEVYLAEDTRLERQVALKFLPPHIAREPDALERFKREAKATAALRHPNIVTIHEIGVHEDRHFIAMSYIEGDLLTDVIERHELTVDDALAMTLELCDALCDAHRAGIIHRDLKPANIIVDSKDRPHVLDFGLAYKIGATKLTQDGTTVGSLHYMSPEQSRGDSVDARTDVFSLGAILYEMIAGRPAFPGDHAAAIQYKIAHEDPQPLARFNNKVTPELERIVSKALCRDRDVRYQTMEGFAAALKPLRAPTAGERAEEKSAWEMFVAAGTAVARILLRPAVISGALLGIVGFAAGMWLTDSDNRLVAVEERQSRPLARYAIPYPIEMPVVPRPECSAIAISPDGQYIVYATTEKPYRDTFLEQEPAMRTYLCGREIDSYEIVPIDGTTGAAAPFFSPDGRWIGYMDYRDFVLKKVARRGGAPVEICDVLENFRGACWGDDGRIYFGAKEGIYVVPDGGGSPTLLTAPDQNANEKTRRFPDVLPGSKAVLFTRGTTDITSYDDADIALYVIKSGETRVLVPGGTNPRYLPTGHIAFARGGKLYAIRFNPETFEVQGTPVPVLDGLVTSDGYGGAHFGFSRNGTLVFVPGGPEHYYSEITTIDRDGRVEDLEFPARLYGDAQISPDGKRLVLSILGANASLWIYDMQRGITTRMTRAWDNYTPSWRNSREITFGSNRGGNVGVWSMAADGGGKPEKLMDLDSNTYVGSWTGDGQWLCFAPKATETSYDIWVLSGNEPRTAKPIIATPFQEFDPAFSPDNSWVAYVSDETGQAEIYVQPFPTTGQKWKLSEDGGDTPEWSADGEELFFLNGQELMSVAVETTPEFVPSRPKTLLTIEHCDVQYFDVFPDGQRFMIIGPLRSAEHRQAVIVAGAHHRIFPSATPEIRVVVNWFEDLP